MVRYAKRRSGLRKRRPALRRGGRKMGRSRQSVRRAKQGLPKRQLLQSNLGGLTMSRFVASRRPNGVASTIKRTGQPNFVNITYPGVVQAVAGFQGVSGWYLSAGNDLRRIWASTQGQYTRVNPTTSAELVSSSSSTPYTATNASFRIVLESAISQLQIANTSGTPVNMELYDVVAKRDSGQLPTDFLGNLLPGGGKYGQGTLMLDPVTAWKLGMTNETTNPTGFETAALITDAGISQPQNLGSTPYQSKLFKDYFKVVRKTNVSLPIGGQHKHFVDLKPNVIFDNDMLQQNNIFKGVSMFTVIVISGIPVVKCPDANPSEHPLANPLGDTISSRVNVSVLQQVRYKWTWVEDSRENIYRANYINTLNTAAAQTTQPAMVKLVNADNDQQGVDKGSFTLQPSECTI